jgi:hypothetical protein
MTPFRLLIVDAAINLVLGLVLMCLPTLTVQALGLPAFQQTFYPSVLGAVLIGIAVALFIESWRKQQAFVGLGLGGAIVINLCGGLALAGWLLLGGLELPIRGHIIMWMLVVVLVGISGAELWVQRSNRPSSTR